MGLGAGIDILLIVALVVVSLVGLVRGFLSEVASIVNWVGSAYLAATLRPVIVRLLSHSPVPSPFVNTATSASLFVVIIIAMSIVNRVIVEKVRYYVPASINGGLGFFFGFFKGVLLLSLILSLLNIISRRTRVNYLSDSLVNDIMVKSNGFFMNSINNLMESFVGKDLEIKLEQEKDEEDEEDRAIIEQAKEVNREKAQIDEEIKRIKKETKKDENTDLDKLINIL
jgi:uncharacterized membrane protein required for colicin V production